LWGSLKSECCVAMKLRLSIFKRFVDDYLDSITREDLNPVQKVPLHIMNNNGRLQIVKIRETPATQQQQQPNTGANQCIIYRGKSTTTSCDTRTQCIRHVQFRDHPFRQQLLATCLTSSFSLATHNRPGQTRSLGASAPRDLLTAPSGISIPIV
jgi:hypothetical protein